MAKKQKLGIRAYSFSFKQYHSRNPEKAYKLNEELHLNDSDDNVHTFSTAMDLFREFIALYQHTNDQERNQQLFRCSFDEANEGYKDNYHYLIFSVHSGYYGFPSNVIDRNTKATVFKKTRDQADVKEFYVMVVIPTPPNTRGLIFFQEMGIYGIKTVTTTLMQDYFSNKYGLTFQTQNLAPDFYLEKLFRNGIIKRIRLARNVVSADQTDRLYPEGIGREERAFVPLEITNKLKKNLRNIASGAINYYTFDQIDYPEVKMEVTIADRTRTVNLRGIEELSVEEALPDSLLKSDGSVCMNSFTTHMHPIVTEYLEHLPTSI